MSNAFDSLNVNLSQLSTALGLSSTLSASDIDFQNLSLSYDANSDSDKAISAPFKYNSNYVFTLFTDGIHYIKPTIASVSSQYIKYFDLEDGLVSTISNYNSSSYSFSSASGGYMASSQSSRSTTVGCGQRTVDCMNDAYTNHGWVSVWAWIQSAFIPQTVIAIAATCALHSCL